MTWDEALEFDKRRKMVELSPEAQRWIESFAFEVGPSADTLPKVTYTTTADSLRAARPDFLSRYEFDYLQNDIGAVAEAYGFLKVDEERYKRKEDKIMANEIRRKDYPINLGKYETDIDPTERWSDAMFHPEYVIIPAYKRVIFNPPATIILWKDKTKTVVKCGPNDVYDPEKGLAMCLLKKLCGNDGIMFHRTIRKMMESYEPPVEETESPTDTLIKDSIKYRKSLKKKLKEMTGIE